MSKKLFRHRVVVSLCALALLLILGGFTWAFLSLRALGTNSFILHFSDMDGITNIGGLGMIFFMGAFGVLVTLMNFFIAMELDARGAFVGKFLAAMTLVLAALLFIAFAAIINVNV